MTDDALHRFPLPSAHRGRIVRVATAAAALLAGIVGTGCPTPTTARHPQHTYAPSADDLTTALQRDNDELRRRIAALESASAAQTAGETPAVSAASLQQQVQALDVRIAALESARLALTASEADLASLVLLRQQRDGLASKMSVSPATPATSPQVDELHRENIRLREQLESAAVKTTPAPIVLPAPSRARAPAVNHGSHASHRSHSSHRSHRSHRSGR